jgi:hypothetical protein
MRSNSRIKFSTVLQDFDFLGLLKGPNRLIAGLISRWLSCLLDIGSTLSSEVLVPSIEEFVLAPIMWVVFFCGSMEDRKADS